jgi:hypothetical protein
MDERHDYVITGVFSDRAAAEAAARSLREVGLAPAGFGPVEPEDSLPAIVRTGLRGFASGAITGALLAIVLEATLLFFPGRGPFGTGGWLAAAVTGAVAGGLAGAAVRLVMALVAARRGRRRLGRAVAVNVAVGGRLLRERARFVFQRAGAIETRVPLEEEVRPAFARGFAEVAPALRRRWTFRHRAEERRWEQDEPHYRYGWQMANRPDFTDREWADAMRDVATEWTTRHPDQPWVEVSDQIAEGWASAREQKRAS